MADTKTTDKRHDAALESIAKALGTTAAELTGEAKGDPQLARTITMENIAAALKSQKSKTTSDTPPTTVETVKEEPLKTTETVEVKE